MVDRVLFGIELEEVLVGMLGSLDVTAERMLAAFRHGWWFIAITAAVGAVTPFGITSHGTPTRE
ncbi:hypothetical protein NDR87_34760 [Nocardia sp. CDC159]|uniref:Uncharacterized protein n=1 Tax=Nocardia pulmonis TaxID=2951408 RepID=A0A9X2EH95_9NOCA|nr:MULTISPECIES: hypothetical protein [Nocardia]MCM6778653.1 hypothetical protein [Nocardia pulmonis]MCM6791542.1 hypothetical protein [Nocardia sp. CDC159]